MLFTVAAAAQTKPISGRITDITGTPIPNASIRTKGASAGTSADMTGSFHLNVGKNAVLIVSAIGYETKEVKAGSLDIIDIQMSTDSKSLSEVVVTGTGTATSRKKLGISVETVTADKLPAAPTASIDQALIGKIPGAQISATSGNPGDPINILLRGINTVQGGTKPLILMDGVEVKAADISSLDLSSIERVETVQGAASASIYGAQGANGVIQLFTRKGRQGKASINFSSSYAANSYINSGNVHKARLHPYLTDANNNIIDYASGQPLTLLDDGTLTGISYQFADNVAGDQHAANSRYGILSPDNINNKPYNANLKYYDHFKQVFKTGYSFNNSLNISGGNEKTDYFVGASNSHTISPILKNGYFERSNLTANVGAEVLKGLKLRSVTQLIYTRNTMAPGLGGGGDYWYGKGQRSGNVGAVYGFLNTSPFFDLTHQDADGNYIYYPYADFLSVNAGNPYYVKQYSNGLDNKIDIIQNFDASYKVNHFVELDAKYGVNYRTENSRWTYFNQSENINSNSTQSWIYYNNNNDNLGEITDFRYSNMFQNILGSLFFRTDFQKDFKSRLPITTSTQVSFDYRKQKYTEYITYGMGVPLKPPINMTTVGDPNLTSSVGVNRDYIEPFVTYGYLVNQKIDFGDYGGVTGGFRSDWSSAFGGGHTPFTFPHADAYILPSSFDFWEKLSDFLPTFKLRGAYGKAGIQPGPFDRYPTLDPGILGSNPIFTNPNPSQNPNLQVEVSREWETGADITLNTNKNGAWFNGINLSATYWNRKSSNVIYTVATALSTGTPGQLTNAIDMSSKGFQFSIDMPVFKSRDFSWQLTTNFGHQTSMVDKIAGKADIILGSAAGSTSLVLRAGQKVGQIYGYKAFTSLDQRKLDGTPYIDKADYDKYEMVNGKVVEKDTRAIMFTNETYALGDPNPKFNISFINSFDYKGMLTLSVQFDWLHGSHLYNQTKEWMYRDGISGDFEKPVTIGGTRAAYTAYWASAYYGLWGSSHGPGNNATKDFFYEDASFVRLRNVALAFDLTKAFKIKYFNKLQLVLTGRNIATFTKYSGYDPEVSSGTVNSAWDRGVDHSTLPNQKSYQVGLNVGL